MGNVVSLQKGGYVVTREENENAISARLREAREKAGLTQQDLAAILRVGHEAYRKYETRSAFPAALVAEFCLVTTTEIEWLLTGKVRARKVKARPARGSVTMFKPRQVKRAG